VSLLSRVGVRRERAEAAERQARDAADALDREWVTFLRQAIEELRRRYDERAQVAQQRLADAIVHKTVVALIAAEATFEQARRDPRAVLDTAGIRVPPPPPVLPPLPPRLAIDNRGRALELPES
jgi:hypothetical protein